MTTGRDGARRRCRSPLATGAGAESRRQIGWVIVGGLLVGTFFTLFVIPAAYTFIARRGVAAATPEPHPLPQPAE